MDSTPVETFPVHEYLRSKLCSLYENDCIFDKFECVWNGTDRQVTLFFTISMLYQEASTEKQNQPSSYFTYYNK